MFQSLLINGLAIWVIIADDERRHMDWEQRIWGYTGAAGMIQALAGGYFVWDFVVTLRNFDVFGFGTLAHAVAAMIVYLLGFRPLVNYYSAVFILWELSTPFLNIHWFMDKIGMTGSNAQLYNGIALLFTFFSCRLVYGTYQSVRVFRDIWPAVNSHPSPGLRGSPIMAFASEKSTVPLWLAVIYLVSNLTLNSLNFYWFVMMIRAVRKRFDSSTGQIHKEPLTEIGVDLSSVASGTFRAPHKAQRRKE
ncbi:hypothetical protein CDD82_288 [Ophiocordyceps australis]|uniref:TLC domain-containing protein n=1 Tax=Ophiocordyceps australis TaxID=1399860 RepID=A0A2C5YJ55_9HYPO|nr:hypothetical protein CDD82_288 [Ophiocordyceps australis]